MRAPNKENASRNAQATQRPPLGSGGSRDFRPNVTKRGMSHVASLRGSGSSSSLLNKSISESGPELFGAGDDEDDDDDDEHGEGDDEFVVGDLSALDKPMAFDPNDNHVRNASARPRRQTTVGSEMSQHNQTRMAGE
jgi:hypothetical protein